MSLGLNLQAASKQAAPVVLPDIVNPTGYDWHDSRWDDLDESQASTFLQRLRETDPTFSNTGFTLESLNDDYQQLFVHMVLDHTQHVLECLANDTTPEPLRLLLFGTAGSGKTHAVKTALQEMKRHLEEAGFPITFVRVAAPTGSAAFNIKFHATTIHQLIHWFTPPYFNLLKEGSVQLDKFQQYLSSTELLVLDEISMVGRQMMGRIDSRMRQGVAGRDQADEHLGNLSLIGVGDPAQCEAIMDQQIYDVKPHKNTVEGTSASSLSNKGLEIYSSMQKVIILTKCHRLSYIQEPANATEEEYNERAMRFVQVLRKLRDLNWSLEDYYWLCSRKKSKLTFAERARFQEAPVIMDFRRSTESNPENNCEFFNSIRLRAFAHETKTKVTRFNSIHVGVSQEAGQKLEDSDFRGLPVTLELAVGARVILFHTCVFYTA